MTTLVERDISDWYWVVEDTTASTNVYSTATNGYVANNAAAYSTWLTNGNWGYALDISAMADNGSGKVRLTVGSTARLLTNQRWFFEGLDGTPLANGLQQITVVDATHVDITAVTFVASTLASDARLRGASIISSEAELLIVINTAAIIYNVPSYNAIASANDITLTNGGTNSLARWTEVSISGSNKKVILPPMNTPTSWPIGAGFSLFNNLSGSEKDVTVYYADGITPVLGVNPVIGTLRPAESLELVLIDNSTANGAVRVENGPVPFRGPRMLTAAYDAGAIIGGHLEVSAASSALTIKIVDADGNNPSLGGYVFVRFRDATGTLGGVSEVRISASTSLVISSGSTLGVPSNKAFRLWVVGFNDGGTFRLGVINCLDSTAKTLYPLVEGIASSVAEGGAGGADSSGVIYTGTAVSSKPMRILGYIEWNTSGLTAGTWTTTNLLRVQAMGPGIRKPGDVVQQQYMTTTTQTSVSNTTPVATAASKAITPTSAANLIRATSSGTLYCDTAATGGLGEIYRGGASIGGIIAEAFSGAGSALASVLMRALDLPNSLSAQTYAVYIYLNAGSGPNAYYPLSGNNRNVDMLVEEIMA